MKYEPLKGKTLLWNQITGDIETTDGRYFLETKTEDAKFFRIFLKKDVKSAVQGLLEEIESRIKELENGMERTEFPDTWNYLASAKSELEWCIKKIKKWFADVVEEVDEE